VEFNDIKVTAIEDRAGLTGTLERADVSTLQRLHVFTLGLYSDKTP